jgi:hypothetical protein
MLWRELQQRGDQALQKSNKRWLVLGLRAKDHDSRMGFGRVCSDIREVQVQRHQHTIFRAATLGALNRQHQKVSRRGPYLLRSLPHEGSARILLEGFRRF